MHAHFGSAPLAFCRKIRTLNRKINSRAANLAVPSESWLSQKNLAKFSWMFRLLVALAVLFDGHFSFVSNGNVQ